MDTVQKWHLDLEYNKMLNHAHRRVLSLINTLDRAWTAGGEEAFTSTVMAINNACGYISVCVEQEKQELALREAAYAENHKS